MFIRACYSLYQGLRQSCPKYLAPPGTTILAEYMQVIPEYTQLDVIVQQCNRKIHRVAPDGNCLFRTLSHQALGDQIYHSQLRKALVTLVSDNMEIYKSFYIGRNSFCDHVSSMFKDGIWGTQVEIQAAADYFVLPVYELMYNSITSSHKWIVFKPHHGVSDPSTEDTMPQPYFPFKQITLNCFTTSIIMIVSYLIVFVSFQYPYLVLTTIQI